MNVIVDYGMGNSGSILNMIRKIGDNAIISSSPEDINKASKLILPGVGSFDRGVENLRRYNLIDALDQKVLVEKTPILGICLGMQLFTKSSEEGVLPGFGWFDADTVKFEIDKDLKVPHMGWNYVDVKDSDLLFKDFNERPRFYFVHSYHVQCRSSLDIISSSSYGIDFVSAIRKGNIYATQFHPEKSHKFGLRLMSNFLELK